MLVVGIVFRQSKARRLELFWIVRSRNLRDCFRQFGTKCGDYFRIVRNQNFGTALGSLGTDFGLILVHEYCLCVIAKMNNMTDYVKIILLMHAQLMY